MANISITNLPAATSVTGTDSVPIVQTSTTVRATLSQIAAYTQSVYPAPGVTSVATSGPITGGTITSTGTIGLNTGGVTNTYLGTMPTLTLKGNSTGGAASPSDLSTSTVMTMLGAAPLASPTFTGTPLAPTPSTSDSSTKIATTAFVTAQGYGTGTVTSVGQTFTGGLIAVSGSPITTSGTLALTVAGTSGGVPYFSSASTWASSAALAANAIVVGGGAGAAPATVTTGTGVVTALGVNTGTAGAFVVNGGALGTPSSGTLTNATGLPVGGISATGTPSSTTYLRGDGTWSTVSGGGSGTVNSGTSGQLTYYSATGTAVSGNANATISSGALTLGVAGTTAGSLLLSGSTSGAVTVNSAAAAGTWTLTLPTTAGTNGYVLSTNGSGVTSWVATSGGGGTVTSVAVSGGTTGLTTSGGPITGSGTITLAGTLAAANGGTGQTSYAIGDLLYASAATTLSKLADVATGSVLVSGGVGAAPAYSATPTLTSLTAAAYYGGTGTGSTLTLQSTTGIGATDSVVIKVGNNGATTALTAASSGTVTIGTLNLTNALGLSYGGTGQTTKTAAFDALSPMTQPGDIILGGTSGTGTRLAIGTSTYVLTSNGTTAVWTAPSSSSGTVNSGTSGQLTYYGATGTTVSGNANLTVSSGALTIGVAGTTAGTLLLSGATNGTTTLAVAAAASGTLTLPSATTTLAGLGIAQTFTATNTFNQINYANNAVTVTSNAGTVPITYRLNTFTNSSAATMAITMAVTSAVDGQMSIVRIYDYSANPAAQTIGWTNTENSSVSVPTTSNGSATLPLTVGFMYNSQTLKWRCVASA